MKTNASYNHFGLSVWNGALARWKFWFVRPARSVAEAAKDPSGLSGQHAAWWSTLWYVTDDTRLAK